MADYPPQNIENMHQESPETDTNPLRDAKRYTSTDQPDARRCKDSVVGSERKKKCFYCEKCYLEFKAKPGLTYHMQRCKDVAVRSVPKKKLFLL